MTDDESDDPFGRSKDELAEAAEWDRYWTSLTPAEQKVEIHMMDNYDGCDEHGNRQ